MTTPMKQLTEKMKDHDFFQLWKTNQELYADYYLMKEREAYHDAYMEGWKNAIEHSKEIRSDSKNV